MIIEHLEVEKTKIRRKINLKIDEIPLKCEVAMPPHAYALGPAPPRVSLQTLFILTATN